MGNVRARRPGVECDPGDMPNNDRRERTPDGEAAPEAPTEPKLSRKEQARQLRCAAYQRAKEQRANDPRLVAIKEAMKLRRGAAYQEVKERTKVAVAEQKTKLAAPGSTVRAKPRAVGGGTEIARARGDDDRRRRRGERT